MGKKETITVIQIFAFIVVLAIVPAATHSGMFRKTCIRVNQSNVDAYAVDPDILAVHSSDGKETALVTVECSWDRPYNRPHHPFPLAACANCPLYPDGAIKLQPVKFQSLRRRQSLYTSASVHWGRCPRSRDEQNR